MDAPPTNPLEVKPREVLSAGRYAGTKPPAFAEQEAMLKSILAGGEPEVPPVGVIARTQMAQHEDVSIPKESTPPAAAPQRSVRSTPPAIPTHRVKLRHVPTQAEVPGFVMEFDIYDYDVSDLTISLELAHNFVFAPTDKMDLILTLNGRDYKVFFLGGVLRFHKRQINAISFFREQQEEIK